MPKKGRENIDLPAFVIITGLSGSGMSSATDSLEDLGYFCVDSEDSSAERLVFNRTVTLRDTWAKIEKSGRRN